jgi:hypothetical protein
MLVASNQSRSNVAMLSTTDNDINFPSKDPSNNNFSSQKSSYGSISISN